MVKKLCACDTRKWWTTSTECVGTQMANRSQKDSSTTCKRGRL